MAASGSMFIVQDGQAAWFDGPDYNDVVADVFTANQERVEDYAKQNAPWTDQTGEARAGLNASVIEDSQGEILLTLAHGVDYGIWLEVIQNGEYAIIMPTLEALYPEIFNQTIAAIKDARKGENFV